MLLANPMSLNLKVLFFGNLGIALMSLSAGSINQLLDQRIDKIMHRTKKRPLLFKRNLNEAINKFERVEAITFNYGQKHNKEIDYAARFCAESKIPHEIVNLDLEKILSGSALVGDTEIPEGNYDKEKMKQTVVPNRNMIMISVAASLAIKNELDYLWYGAHAGDHEIYPDCRPEFIDKLGAVLSICDYHSYYYCCCDTLLPPFVFK
mgnify:CR=1 FL=1